ncbi:hypothetical protein SNE40_009131 [Patella caerulea]|uniref:Uncharacterized protein n=1 Tax=Patella caerulea TaxID=87958 RepID=A0AAN8JNM9_PATCE
MTANSMGAFGAYKHAYSRYVEEQARQGNPNCGTPNQEDVVTWVTKRYIPTDLRLSAPVPRHKIITTHLPQIEDHWIIVNDPPLRCFERRDDRIYSSHPSSRSQEWSTLRQTLPSRGTMNKPNPPCWGTGHGTPSTTADKHPKRFPIVNSPMTRYVDAMHLTNRLFKLH